MSGDLHLEGRDRGCMHLLEGVTQDSKAGKCVTILFTMLATFTASVGILQPQAYRKRPHPLLVGMSMCVLLFITKQWFSVQWGLTMSFILLAPPNSFVNNIWHEAFLVVINEKGQELGRVIVTAFSSKELGMLLNVLQHTDRI